MEEVGSQLAEYPQLKSLLNDFVSSVLLHKPDDVYTFARSYFSTFHFNSEDNNHQKPKPIVFCGPSGVGKGTLIDKLMQEYPNKFGFSVSHTTRKSRPNEKNGVHYHFTTLDEINKAISEGKFVEHANVHGNVYGTSKASIESVMNTGQICILDIDVQGAEQVKKSTLNPLYLFITPPSLEELEKRLRARNTETEESILRRLHNAKGELKYLEKPDFWDQIIKNDDLDSAYLILKQWIKAEYNL